MNHAPCFMKKHAYNSGDCDPAFLCEKLDPPSKETDGNAFKRKINHT